jgi:hypothetical protein
MPLIISLGLFRIFLKIRGYIRSSRFATGVNDTGGKWKKTFKQKNFNNLVWTPLGSRVDTYINFCHQVKAVVGAHMKEYKNKCKQQLKNPN